MAGVRFADLQSRPTEFLDFTSLTLDAFQQLVPPFEAAFQAPMAAWRLAGKPRTARRFSVDQHCPLPAPEERWLFILAYVKTYALQGQPFQGIRRIRFSWPGFSQWRRGHRFCMPFVALVSSWDRADVSGNVAG